MTRRKIPFHRTPKVGGRTSAPAPYVLAEIGLLLGLAGIGIADFATQRYLFASAALLNAAFLAYAVVRYVGFSNGWEDCRRAWMQPKPALAIRGERLIAGRAQAD